MTKQMKCTCINSYQDEKHGKGIRVHNKTEKSPGRVYRCTVCGATNTAKVKPSKVEGGKKDA